MIPDTLKQVADSLIVRQGVSQTISYVVLAIFIVVSLFLLDKTILSSIHK
jgi:hypothetical protein